MQELCVRKMRVRVYARKQRLRRGEILPGTQLSLKRVGGEMLYPLRRRNGCRGSEKYGETSRSSPTRGIPHVNKEGRRVCSSFLWKTGRQWTEKCRSHDLKTAHLCASAQHRQKQFLPRLLRSDIYHLVVHSQEELDGEYARHQHTSVQYESKLATTLCVREEIVKELPGETCDGQKSRGSHLCSDCSFASRARSVVVLWWYRPVMISESYSRSVERHEIINKKFKHTFRLYSQCAAKDHRPAQVGLSWRAWEITSETKCRLPWE